jgi:hypothetical protein
MAKTNPATAFLKGGNMKKIIYVVLILLVFPVYSWADANADSKSGAVAIVNPTIQMGSGITAPEVFPVNVPILQSGKIGDVTAILPEFDNPALVKLVVNDIRDSKGVVLIKHDIVVKVLDVYYGYWCDRITYEEVESYLISKASNYDGSKGKIRYSVKYKDASHALAVGGGGGASGISNEYPISGTGIVGVGGVWAVHSPYFIITFYEVK